MSLADIEHTEHTPGWSSLTNTQKAEYFSDVGRPEMTAHLMLKGDMSGVSPEVQKDLLARACRNSARITLHGNGRISLVIADIKMAVHISRSSQSPQELASMVARQQAECHHR